ncbi:hypothetical protein P4056_08670 [Pseudomonas aeruginosa]|nr:hypothetical protein [Pseudomonas aeruginosa]MDF6002605.1 hypothetical protein [Pseudomonas aeruginosa]
MDNLLNPIGAEFDVPNLSHQVLERLRSIQEAAENGCLAEEQADHPPLFLGGLALQDGVEDQGVGTPGEIIALTLARVRLFHERASP